MHPEGVSIVISFGVVQMHADASIEESIDAAERALTLAKAASPIEVGGWHGGFGGYVERTRHSDKDEDIDTDLK